MKQTGGGQHETHEDTAAKARKQHISAGCDRLSALDLKTCLGKPNRFVLFSVRERRAIRFA
jgi:hypothetical protein